MIIRTFIFQLMRSGTRKVSDSKPDPQATNAQGDSIALELIGNFRFSHIFFKFFSVFFLFSQ